MRAVLLVVAVAVAAGVLFWWTRHEPARSRAAAVAPATRSPEARAREVDAIVAQRNQDSAAHRQGFEADGWTFVDVAEPDRDLVSASPSLLQSREAELRAQLASAPPGREHLANVVVIATSARDSATRIAAVEAIARMGSGQPRQALVDLVAKLPANDPARRTLVPLLQPDRASDPLVDQMIALLDSPLLANDEKAQIAMTLALVALRDGVKLDRPMSTSARELIARMTSLAQRS